MPTNISEKSSNENGHILPRMSKHLFNAFSFDDFSVFTGPKIMILIYLKRTYYGHIYKFRCFKPSNV